MTLSQKSLRTLTTASCSASYLPPDTLTLNGNPEDIQSSKRTQACLANLRAFRASLESHDPSLPKLSTFPLRIVTENNFPTAAGLASSAAGFAALVRAVADLYDLPQTPEQLSLIARQGSGSACRSLMGGFVAWRAGETSDGSDSIAECIAPESHWPELRALILVCSEEKKSIGSTQGMQLTTTTSELFPVRAKEIVPRRMTEMESAIKSRDFEAFAKITMQDSNNFHACCYDTWPPIHYLNDASLAAINAVTTINRRAGKLVAAYTFDAGPNAVIYYLAENTHLVAGVFKFFLVNVPGWEGEYGDDNAIQYNSFGGLEATAVRILKGKVKRVICTAIGGGPEASEAHLVDPRGRPVEVAA